MNSLESSTAIKFGPVSWPVGLKSLGEISEILAVSEERIMSLVEGGFIPHYRIDGEPPLFRVVETKDWAANNLLKKYDGAALPPQMILNKGVENPPLDFSTLPAEMRNLDGLRDVSDWIGRTCGIYFLIDAGAIVYIGQSVHAASRVCQHTKDKKFTAAYFLPIPKSELNRVEGALIRHFAPPLNGGQVRPKKLVAPQERSSGEDALTKQQLGLDQGDAA